MAFEAYIEEARRALDRVSREQGGAIRGAAAIVARSLEAGGVLHAFGAGHSHLLAEEAFYRAGGLTAINPILDGRLIFLEGALESTRAEREVGYATRLLDDEDVRPGDAAIVASNSGRNVVPVEMALEFKRRGVGVVAITSLAHSRVVDARHASGRKLFEIADVVIDTGTPVGDASITLPDTTLRMGPLSTILGAAIVNSIIIETAQQLVRAGRQPPVLPSANLDTTTEEDLARALAPYADRIRYIDVPAEWIDR